MYNTELLIPTPSTHDTSVEEQRSTTLWCLVRMRNSAHNTSKRKQKLSTKRIWLPPNNKICISEFCKDQVNIASTPFQQGNTPALNIKSHLQHDFLRFCLQLYVIGFCKKTQQTKPNQTKPNQTKLKQNKGANHLTESLPSFLLATFVYSIC